MATDLLFFRQPWYTVPLSAVTGFLVSYSIGHIIMDYIVLFFFGILIGRMLHRGKYGEKEILVMNIIGFFVGYSLGSLGSNWKGLLIMIVVSAALSYRLHEMGIMKRYNI